MHCIQVRKIASEGMWDDFEPMTDVTRVENQGCQIPHKRNNGLQISEIYSVPIVAIFLTLITTSDADNNLRENEKWIIDFKKYLNITENCLEEKDKKICVNGKKDLAPDF